MGARVQREGRRPRRRVLEAPAGGRLEHRAGPLGETLTGHPEGEHLVLRDPHREQARKRGGSIVATGAFAVGRQVSIGARSTPRRWKNAPSDPASVATPEIA